MFRSLVVGTATMAIADEIKYHGHKVLVLKTTAKSSPGLARFYEVNDEIKSYYDPVKRVSHTFSKRMHEGNYHREYFAEFDFKSKTCNWWERKYIGNLQKLLESGGKDLWSPKSGFLNPIPATTLDVLSAIYWIRSNPESAKENTEFSIQVFDDLQLIPMKIQILNFETITLKEGETEVEFDTIKIKPSISTSGIFRSDGELTMWVTNDEDRIPLRIESKVKPFGKIVVELISYQ